MGATARVNRTATLRMPRPGHAPGTAVEADSRGWHARTWLGAPGAGGLSLPSATAAADTLYAPRGVWLDDDLLVAADTGNHRLLLWYGRPEDDHRPADVLLGQSHWAQDAANDGGRGPESGLHLPTGVLVCDGALVVCDAWNHRILVWWQVPDCTRPADLVLGQSDASHVEPNRGGEPNAASFYWPFGAAIIDGGFWVADTGNRRVLGWLDGVPESPDQPADVVLGQSSSTDRAENRGGPAGTCSFRWPHAIADVGGAMIVADAGDHRLLGWARPPLADTPADLVIGQPDFATAAEFPYAPQSAAGLRFPYGVTAADGQLAVADTANNRILLWERAGWFGAGRDGVIGAADGVLAQPTMAANGENRWEAVTHDTLCWPYGLCRRGERLAVADSGNNRIIIWERS